MPLPRGFKHSDATRKKMSEATTGKANHFYGKYHTDETKRKMREARKGDRNSNWRGGINPKLHAIRTSLEYRLWRERIFARDKYTCQWCGDNRGGNLNAHHLINISKEPKLAYDPRNGITLCGDCHILIHKNKKKMKIK